MLATTIDTFNIPSLWYPAVQQIQAASAPPPPTYLDTLSKGYYIVGSSSTVTRHKTNLPRVEKLGWSGLETLETHLRFCNFADDWDAPGMEAYDEL